MGIPTLRAQPAALVALAKSFCKQTADVVLPAGLHHVDEVLTVHVRGTVSKAADGEYAPPVEVPLVELLAAALKKAGCNREEARAAIDAALPLVLGGWKPGNPDRIRDAEDAIEAFKSSRKADQPKKARAGAVKADVSVEFIAVAELAAAAIAAA